MAEPFLSEIRIMSFNFAPKGWAKCDGQLLPINQNQALFALLGTTYGGNGSTNFALPNLRGRTPIHAGSGHTLGEAAGSVSHTLNLQEMPEHNHALVARGDLGDTPLSPGKMLAATNNLYAEARDLVALNPAMVSNIGGGQAHQNMQPYLTLNFCIAVQGIFPSPN